MSRAHHLWLMALTALTALSGCPAAPTEPPPPPRKPELIVAPPSARGARAAGTDAAPKPELGLPVAEDGSPLGAPTEPPPEADAGAPDSPSAPGTPDAGTAL